MLGMLLLVMLLLWMLSGVTILTSMLSLLLSTLRRSWSSIGRVVMWLGHCKDNRYGWNEKVKRCGSDKTSKTTNRRDWIPILPLADLCTFGLDESRHSVNQ